MKCNKCGNISNIDGTLYNKAIFIKDIDQKEHCKNADLNISYTISDNNYNIITKDTIKK